MDSFEFNSLDHDALQQTLAYFNANPEPQPIDYEFTSYRAMMGDALEEMHVERAGDERAFSKGFGDGASPNGKEPPSTRPTMLPCTWTGCDQSIGGEDMTVHLTGHGHEAIERFTAPSRCVWPDCSSKATFKTLSAYKHHLNNIHVKPLICPITRCSYKKPFRNQDDLDRHSATIHSDVKKYECPYESCESETKFFARKDKWLKHIQETLHENDAFCPYYHCVLGEASTSRGFRDRKQISKHFDHKHALNGDESYECALDLCANATYPSRWSKLNLREHLYYDHGLGYPFDVKFDWKFVYNMEDKDRVLTTKHLPDPTPKGYHDCKVCATSDQHETSTAAVPGAQSPLDTQLEGLRYLGYFDALN